MNNSRIEFTMCFKAIELEPEKEDNDYKIVLSNFLEKYNIDIISKGYQIDRDVVKFNIIGVADYEVICRIIDLPYVPDILCKGTHYTDSSIDIYIDDKLIKVGKTHKEQIRSTYNRASLKGALEYDEFSRFIHNLLISEDGYVLDTGSNANVNGEIAMRLMERIKEHPFLWKKFFMVG